MGMLAGIFAAIPWGQILIKPDHSPLHSSYPHSPSPSRSSSPRVRPAGEPSRQREPRGEDGGPERPGCQIADACLIVHGYLEELSEGQGGYGVLRLGKERLEAAAVIAEDIGKEDLAESIREVCEKLPEVHTPDAAAELAEEMEPIKKQAWRLGRACGLSH